MNLTSNKMAAQVGLLSMEAEPFRADFNRRPFRIQHRLGDHPLFAMPRLMALAQALPQKNVEYNGGNVPVNMDPAKTPRTGLSAEETLYRIAHCQSWMALKYVEDDPEYRALLDALMDEIQIHSEPLDPGMCLRHGFIFVSSPRAITPYHMDLEYNFLLQIRGDKTANLFDGADRTLLSEEEIERQYQPGKHRNLLFQDAYQQKAMVYSLKPGDGLHFPQMSPHWIQNEGAVSVSFSITFQTAASDRKAAVHHVNRRLRAMGLHPTPPGGSRSLDAAKYLWMRVLNKVRRMMGPAPQQQDRTY
jgi:hypothetical protein